MAFSGQLPVSEGTGVFVGVAGLDWLILGYADLPKALAIGLIAACTILAVRLILKKNRER